MSSRPNSSSQNPLSNLDQPLRFSSSSKYESLPSDSPLPRAQSPTLRMLNTFSSLGPRFRNVTSSSSALLSAKIITKNSSSTSLESTNMDDGSSSENDQFYDVVDPNVTSFVVQRISEELDSNSIMVEEEVLRLSDCDADFDVATTPTDEQNTYLTDKGEKCNEMESSQDSSLNVSSPTQITSNCQPDLDLTRTQRRFASCFPEIAEEARTLGSWYICALEREILWHGHVFVSHNYVTFFGRIFSRAVRVMIHFADIVRVDKHNSMMILPNAIRVTTIGGKTCVLTSFLSRDAAYEEIYNSWWRHRNIPPSLFSDGISPRRSKKSSRPRSPSDLLSESDVLDFVDDSEPHETHSKETSSPLPTRSNTLPLNLIRGGNHGRESSFPLATSTFLSLRARSASISTKRQSRNSPTAEEYIPKNTISTPLSVTNSNDKERPQSKRSMSSKHVSLHLLTSHTTPNSYTTTALSLNPVTPAMASSGSVSAPPSATYSSTLPFTPENNNNEANEQERSSEESFSRAMLGDKKGRGRGDSSASSAGNAVSGTDGKDSLRTEKAERADGKGFLRSLGIGKADSEKEREKEREREKIREEKRRAKDEKEKEKEKERIREKEGLKKRWNASRLSIGLREDKEKEKLATDTIEGYSVDNVDEENGNADEISAENPLSIDGVTLGNDDQLDSDHFNSSEYEDDDELDLPTSSTPYHSNYLSPSCLPPMPTPCSCSSHKKNLLTDTIFPIPVHALFELIFGPDPDVVRRVHERTESKEVKFGEWGLGEGELAGKKVRTVEYMFCIRLVVKRYTSCIETQIIVSVSDGVIVVDTSSIQPQVPYGGTFACVIRYCLTHEGPNKSRLRSSTEMEFKQTHFMSGRIESTALQGTILFQNEMIKEINAWITSHPNDPLFNSLPMRRRLSMHSTKSKIVSRRKNRRHRGGLIPMHESIRITRHCSSSRQRPLPESDASISASSGLSRGLRSRASNATSSKVSTVVNQKHKPSVSVTSVTSTIEPTYGAIASNSSYIANFNSSYPIFHLFSSLFVGLVSLLQTAAERKTAAVLAFTRPSQSQNLTGEPRWLRILVAFGFAMVFYNLYSIGVHSIPPEFDLSSSSAYPSRYPLKTSPSYKIARQKEFQAQLDSLAYEFHKKLAPLREQAMEMRNEVDEMLKTLDLMSEAATKLVKVEWRNSENDVDDN